VIPWYKNGHLRAKNANEVMNRFFGLRLRPLYDHIAS
jgi:hypothetical protein